MLDQDSVARRPPAQSLWARLAKVRPLAIPLVPALVLIALAYSNAVPSSLSLRRSLVGAAVFIAAWAAVLGVHAARRGRSMTLTFVPRRQHYLQACAQGSVLLYWGWYWRPVYEAAPLIGAQLLVAYAVDMLLSWSRRDTYSLGFGPFPVVFSINLFLWFKPDWFYLQLLMISLGFTAKELIRWRKESRLVHIFNPSSFPLAVFSIALLLTGTSDLAFGREIASTQFYPPHMYLMLFLIGLPGQFFFGVTTMTMSAVVTTYVFGLAYYGLTGVYFFYDSYIPIAVFLGMHLLFTDPSTSPRTELGRIVYGALYGLSTVALYAALERVGLPTFYDKLLQVPLLNLSVRLIDRATASPSLRRLDPSRLGSALTARSRHLGYMTAWTAIFVVMSAVQGIGDSHPGQWLPFWQRACAADRRHACAYYETLVAEYCQRGSGWACNELGIQQARRGSERSEAVESMLQGCDYGFSAACHNADAVGAGRGDVRSVPPTQRDYPIVLKGSKGPLPDLQPVALAELACREGWSDACPRELSSSMR